MAEPAGRDAKPKKHSPFAQVVLRKSGETLDLGRKGLIGLSGFSHLLGDHGSPAQIGWWLSVQVVIGGLAILLGIYLQAKAEETA